MNKYHLAFYEEIILDILKKASNESLYLTTNRP